jgi:hypothetical protein
MAKARESDTRLKTVTRTVTLKGMSEIMFDRFAGDFKTQLAWDQKIYLLPGSDVLCLPTINIVSALSSHNTNSFPKRLRDARQFKKIANACLSFTRISAVPFKVKGAEYSPDYIPFTRNGEIITVGKFGEAKDEKSGIYLARHVARLDKGIPNPKERPVLPLPWELSFQFSIFPNNEIKEQEIINLFTEGGYAIGLGTFRGVYGKFEIKKWE